YNKELYKRDFNVEFKFEPTEVTIEGLPDKLTDINQISKEQWNEVYSEVTKDSDIYAKDNNYSDLKLEKVLEFNRKKDSDYISIEFIYSYKNSSGKFKYFNMIYMLSFKSNNKLDISRISIEPIIKNDFNVDYSQPLEEILKNRYPNNNYKVLWSAEN
ncbi:TcpJ, partial [Clostridium perfringens]